MTSASVLLLVLSVGVSVLCAGAVVPASSLKSLRGNNLEQGPAVSGFEDCMKRDSIMCMQMQAFRMARNFFEKASFPLAGGVALVKAPDAGSRSMASDTILVEQQLEAGSSVEAREQALEGYVMEEARGFFEKRNLQWNMGALARSISEAAPEGLKSAVSGLLVEGRGRKKVLRMFLPFLVGLKFKFVMVVGLVYLGVVLLAKKALALSLISIAVSVFLLLKKMFTHGHEEAYHHGGAGWQSHSDAGQVEYAAHSSPVAQQLAFAGQKPSMR